MKTRLHLRRSAGTLAALAVTLGGAHAAAAGAATAPTATLTDGVLSVLGTSARDVMSVDVQHDRISVDFGADGSVDARFFVSQVQSVRVSAGAGDDGVTVSGPGVGDVPITLNFGLGNDGGGVVGDIGSDGAADRRVKIDGSDGNDNLLAAVPGPTTVSGGAGDDLVDGGGAGVGRQIISLGDGNDTYKSSLNAFVGARSDVVDGGAGRDVMEIDGSFADESVNLSANAGLLVVDHSAGRISADNVDDVTWKGFGGLDGGDAVRVGDLSGTDVLTFTANFSAPDNPAAPNNSSDQLTIVGTPLDDHITVAGTRPRINVSGLRPTVNAVQLDTRDLLRIDTLDGHDTVDTSGLPSGLVQLQVL